MAYYSIADYVGDGTTQQFAVPFPYLSQSHVTVLVAGISAAFTWVNAGQISVNSIPPFGQSVRVQRITPLNALLVTFTDASVLEASDLDNSDLQWLYTAQEGRDLITQTLASISSIVSSTGNVPKPSTPANDSSVLLAAGGNFGWSNSPTVVSLGAGSVTVTGATASNSLTVAMNATVGGYFQGNTGSFSGAFGAGSIVTSSAQSGFLSIAAPYNNDATIWFGQADSSGSLTPTTTKPRFSVSNPAATQQLIIGYNDGSGQHNVLLIDNLGGGNTSRLSTDAPFYPAVDATFDIGFTGLRFRNAYFSGNIVVGSSLTFSAVTGVQWSTTSGTLQIKTRTFSDCAWSAESAWTDISATYSNV